ncbi:MAG: glycosyltransferase [Albidovulum sp.]
MAATPKLSVVIPVYNEEAVLEALFARLYPALDALGRRYEIVFVNDGSRDRSAAMLREQFQRRPDVDPGGAVQRQLRPAHGDHGRLRALRAASASSPSTRTCRIRPRRSAPAAREDGRGPRLRRLDPPPAPRRRCGAAWRRGR